MTVNGTRSVLYQVAGSLADYEAVKRGFVGKRIANKVIGRNDVMRTTTS